MLTSASFFALNQSSGDLIVPVVSDADGLDLEAPQAAVPVGINCRLCERADCRQRAQASLLSPDEGGEAADTEDQPSSK